MTQRGQCHPHFEFFHIHPRQLDVEDLLKVSGDPIPYPVMIGFPSQEILHAHYFNSIEPAGCDKGLVVHVG
jgi:hypothetical protein